MKRFVVRWLVCSGLVCFVVLSFFSRQVLAGESPFSVSLSGQIVPFISGSAGNGDDSPDFSDAFQTGIAFALEGSYRLNSSISILAGVGYEHYSGEKVDGISFDSLDLVPVYLGCKYHIMPAQKGWNPYLRADIGFAKISSVDISYLGSSVEYWDSSWELMADAGAGFEYKFDTFGFFMEIRARYLDAPSSSLDRYSDADSSWSLPVVAGISLAF